MTKIAPEHVVTAIYASHADAAAALHALQGSGFDMQKWSILGRDVPTPAHAFGFYSDRGQMRFWAGTDSAWTGVWSMLSGGGCFVLPALGPVVVMGPLVDWISEALSTLAVHRLADVPAPGPNLARISHDDLAQYGLAVNAGCFLLLARGSALLAESARGVLADTGACRLSLTAAMAHSTWESRQPAST